MPSRSKHPPRVLAISGGIGGAKLDLGLYNILQPWDLAIVANTGDDFEHLGLTICPDLDTIMYTLSGESDEQKGWGVSGESWACLTQLKDLGSKSAWFGLGDKDLAVHLHRTEQLRAGRPLSEITQDLFNSFDVAAHVFPMAEQPVGTIVHTQDGRDLPFQRYFVEEKCAPDVRGFTYSGAETAQPVAAVTDFVAGPDLSAIILCPSNPFVSINPILSIPGMRESLLNAKVPIIAVSPLVGGQAIKGPLADMLREMGQPVSNQTIASQYRDFLTGIVVDHQDADDEGALSVPTLVTNTIMKTTEDRNQLAREVLAFADRLKGE